MNHQELKCAIELAKCLNFAKAAHASHMSPSALSRTIQRLEGEVGATLFARNNRSVQLTDAGQMFIGYAKDVLDKWSLFQSTLDPTPEKLLGMLTVYCSVTAAYSFIPKLLIPFRSKYPCVAIQLHTGDAERALQEVMSDSADISIAPKPHVIPAKLEMVQFLETPLTLIRSQTLQNSRSPWHDLPLVLPREGVAHDLINTWLSKQNIQPRIYARVGGSEAIVALVAAGCGLGIVPKVVYNNSPLKSELVKVTTKPALPALPVGICRKKSSVYAPALSAFWNLILKK